MNNVSDVIQSGDCTGCSACFATCPTRAIAMTRCERGYQLPRIEESACVNCGRCVAVCPHHVEQGLRRPLAAYAARVKDRSVRETCTSGGFVTALARWEIEEGGIAYGAAFENGVRRVAHSLFSDSGSLSRFSGSKYVQSDCSEILRGLAKGDLSRKGVFVGSPCQVAAVRRALGSKGKELLTVEFACRGVPSPGAYELYCDYQERTHGSRIKDLSFRKKSYGYHGSTMSISFENGFDYEGNVKTDQMLSAFFAGYTPRPSCAHCHMRRTPGLADITVFECWHFSDFTGQEDDNSGYTTVLVNSELGLQAFEAVKTSLDVYEIDAEKAISTDGFILVKDPPSASNVDEFWNVLLGEGFGKRMERFLGISALDKVKARLKKSLHALR